MDPLDETVSDAMKALEASSTPSGYFDGLERRILARLDAPEAGMESEAQTHSKSTGVPPRQEDSGLHDIKELAKSQKTRISRRQTSQHELSDSLLASSQSGLHQVALPDPAKMISLPSPEEARALAESAALPAVGAAEAPSARRAPAKRTPVWLYAGGGLIAAAAVIAVVVSMNKGGTKAAETKAAAPSAGGEAAEADKRAEPPSAMAAAGSGSAAMPAPTTATVTPVEPQAEAAKPADEGITTAGIVDQPLAKPDDAKEAEHHAGAGSAAKKEKAPGTVDQATDKGGSKAAGGGAGSGAGSATTTSGKDATKGTADTKTKPKDDLDGAVLGAGDKDELGIADVMNDDKKKKDDAPAKTELTSKELRDGLSKIEGKAKSCYDKYGVAGTAKVKLTVSPSGEVSKASATGDFAGTPTGDCVAAAVKSATFPAWQGAPMSTVYVVLLSD